jgi:hypothetical protein
MKTEKRNQKKVDETGGTGGGLRPPNTQKRKSIKRKPAKRKSTKKARLWPPKYYRGLTQKQALARRAEIERFGAMDWKDPRAYVGFQTDKLARTKRRSSYTVQWEREFPNAKTLEERSRVTGVPVRFLKQVYRRGSAAWRTGHRPGQTTHSWSYPRVSSFLLCGKTHYSTDSDVVREAKRASAKARRWFKRCKETPLTHM